MNDDFYLLLAGGVGAAKFIDGLAHIIDQKRIKVIVNTADDIKLFGLYICPDLDIITYTLANVIDREKGWGFQNESYHCLKELSKFYDISWFNAGDKDLATHIYRSDLFSEGYSKSEITEKICHKLGVEAKILPMCNEKVQTYIKTNVGLIHFEEYYIKYGCNPKILDVEFKGIKNANPIDISLDLIKRAKRIIICPSNPIVSIGTILKVNGIKEALSKVKEKVYGISPIIAGETVKGPADKLLKWANLEVSCFGVAKYYQSFLGNFIIDNKDRKLKSRIQDLGINVFITNTLMNNLQRKKELARFMLEL
ncbi:MAG: 2-phospho-L-lactate transferase [Promethearchaeota archaeon]|nr:MAG: 2-phospho-L-lactate transferase [Candidatus Lokiarchaeota archaeon]